MRATYTSGEGLLLGAGPRWLLLAEAPDDDVVEVLFGLLTAVPTNSAAILEAVRAAGPDGAAASLVLVDLTAGTESSLTRGTGRHDVRDGVHTLALGPGPVAPGGRRLVGGVVAAAAVVLRPEPAAAAVTQALPPLAPAAVLIDGIPPELLTPRPGPPSPPSPPAREAPVETGDPPANARAGRTVRREPARVVDSDHDGNTTHRASAGASGGPAPAADSHLRQATAETVLAVRCPAGHLTAAYSPRCRVCHEPVPPQEPQRTPRPRLGVLHLPDGERIGLDRGVVLGRQPAPVPGGSDWPHLVRLPPEATYVSRSHLTVELDGWLVLATDLGSRGGTTLRVPGRAPQRIRGHEAYVWEPGQVLDLADSYEIVYEVTA